MDCVNCGCCIVPTRKIGKEIVEHANLETIKYHLNQPRPKWTFWDSLEVLFGGRKREADNVCAVVGEICECGECDNPEDKYGTKGLWRR